MNISNLYSSQWLRLIVTFVAGAVFTLVLYPSKKIEERVKQEYQAIIEQKVNEQKVITDIVAKERDEIQAQSRYLESKYTAQISQLLTQVNEMSSHKVSTNHKIVHPDGSSEEWSTVESEDKSSQKMLSEIKSQYDNIVKENDDKWSKKLETEKETIISTYQITIDSLKKELMKKDEEKVTTINEKKLGIEVGATTEKRGYVHGSYDIWHSIFIGGNIESDAKTQHSAGIGLGIRL